VLRPLRLVVFYAAAGVVWWAFVRYRGRADAVGFTLMFEDAPDPIVRTLGLSEIAWLRPVSRKSQDVSGSVLR
jgi:hypothetical protein